MARQTGRLRPSAASRVAAARQPRARVRRGAQVVFGLAELARDLLIDLVHQPVHLVVRSADELVLGLLLGLQLALL